MLGLFQGIICLFFTISLAVRPHRKPSGGFPAIPSSFVNEDGFLEFGSRENPSDDELLGKPQKQRGHQQQPSVVLEHQICDVPSEDEIRSKGDPLFMTIEEVIAEGLEFDVIIIPSGGLAENKEPNDFVKTRLDYVGLLDKVFFDIHGKGVTRYWLSSGRYTPFKPPPMDAQNKNVITEAYSDARYLKDNWDVHGDIILENQAQDTLGNAFFSRLILTYFNKKEEPLNILVTTNEFHMPRVKLTFEWVMRLDPAFVPFKLFFLESPNTGLAQDVVDGRKAKEREGVKNLWCNSRSKVSNMRELSEFIHFNHKQYAFEPERVDYQQPVLSDKILQSY